MNNGLIPVNAGPMFAQLVSAPPVDLPGHPEAVGNMGMRVERVFLSHNNAIAWLSGKPLGNATKLWKAISGTPRVNPGDGVTLAAGAHSAGKGTASKGSVEKRARRT